VLHAIRQCFLEERAGVKERDGLGRCVVSHGGARVVSVLR
jgi:hypothetical protein